MDQPLLDSETMDEIYRFQGGGGETCVERLFDGTRTLAQVCEDGGISATRGLALVERLTRRGELVVLDPQISGFSTLDEAFFASEVAVDEWDWDEPVERATTRVRKALGRLRDRLAHRPHMAPAAAH